MPSLTVCELKYKGRSRFIAYDSKVGVLVNHGRIRTWNNQPKLIDSEVALSQFDYDLCFDLLTKGGGVKLNTARASLISRCLDLMDDICNAVKSGVLENFFQEHRSIARKLFWSCNLPSVTPEGKSYRAFLGSQEVQIIRQILSAGMEIFQGNAEEQD